jgi:hypothetical protein
MKIYLAGCLDRKSQEEFISFINEKNMDYEILVSYFYFNDVKKIIEIKKNIGEKCNSKKKSLKKS